MPKRFEASITTLENTEYFFEIILTDLLNALQAQEQRKMIRQDVAIEGALPTKHQYAEKGKNKKKKNLFTRGEDSIANHHKSIVASSKKSYPPCKHCGKKGHPPFKCWKRLEARCSKCNQLV